MTDALTRLTDALSDRYRIERELGAGGMATVYLAADLKHERPVAIKVLRPELAAVIGAERFLREIKTIATLQHPHILGLIDSGELDGTAYYVMPYVEGESLRDRLLREKQLPIADAVRLATEVAGALDYAHRHGVIHRDIKPENILLHDGAALVADFGIALAVSAAGGTRMTETGMSLGTPHYMSPEQAMGEREITARSDVYALGAVTYEMLVGDPPFTGSTAQAIVAKVVTEKPVPPSRGRETVPSAVEDAVLTALEKLPADRFATAAEFAAALAGATTARTVARVAPIGTQGGPWPGLALVTTLVAVAATGFGAWAWRRHLPPRTMRLAVAFPAGEQIRSAGTRRFALSRDGSRMVYVGPDSVAGDQLWVRDLNSLTARPLAGTNGARAPFFSPDGRSVGYISDNPGDLRVVSITGGPSLSVVRDSALPWGADWDEHGMIYFTNAKADAARVPAGGGMVEVLGRRDSTRGVTEHDWLQALPGGKRVLLQLWHNSIADAELGLLDLATGVVTPIIQGVYGRYIPTGHIAYLTANGSLLVVPVDVSSGTLTGAPVAIAEQILVDATSGSGQFSVSDNGTLAYMAGDGARSAQAVWVDRAGKRTPVDSVWRGQIGAVALSPDGSRLAAAILGAGEQVWVKRLPGGPVSRLTFVGASNARPAWTSDGRRVAFISALGGAVGGRQAWIQRADGSVDAELLAAVPQGVEEVEWSPDGTRYILRIGSTNGARDLVLGTVGDSIPRPLVTGPADEFAPAVSPNGRWFAYASNESGKSEIFVRLLDDPGAGRTQVSVNGGEEPRWAPSGKELYYRTRNGEMMVSEVTLGPTFVATPPRVLFMAPNMATDNFHHAYSVGRDGRFLMIGQAASDNSELVMVFNWFEELKGRK